MLGNQINTQPKLICTYNAISGRFGYFVKEIYFLTLWHNSFRTSIRNLDIPQRTCYAEGQLGLGSLCSSERCLIFRGYYTFILPWANILSNSNTTPVTNLIVSTNLSISTCLSFQSILNPSVRVTFETKRFKYFPTWFHSSNSWSNCW